ncbi:MAG: AMP-binding protein [Actinomycetota bacterium]
MNTPNVVSIMKALADKAAADPNRAAITCGDASVTRGELESRTNRLARAYAERGVTHGRFVTVALPNSVEFYEACIAAWKLGATPQPVSYRLPDRERQAIVELADSALVVGVEPSAHPGRNTVPAHFDASSYDDSPLPDVTAPAMKAPTSGGSTGRPKLIVAGDPGIVQVGAPGMGQKVDGVVCIPGPLYHNAPFSFGAGSLFHGNHLVLLPQFDAEATLAAVDRHRADWILFVPTMMSRISRLPDDVKNRYDLSSLTTVWHMAAPCPPWLKEEWCNWLGGEKIFELYAGTEAQAVTIIRGDEWLAHRGSVGRCVTGEMKVLDPETFEELPPGTIGEIFMRNNRTTYKYLGAEARRSPDGWESLGDMGKIDAEGYVYLTDRRGDMILSGGANIYPAEVEIALSEHPDVVSSAVIGLPDEDLGNRIHAVVQVSKPISEDDLRTFLGERLVRYKVPRSFEFTTEPVRDDAGKVRRSALRDERS